MTNLKDFEAWKNNLNESEIESDEDFLWWKGAIDACWICGIISQDERWKLQELLEDINDKRG